ncbi:SDR family oxidoreductase [Nocardioides sp. LHD-245]|uniref:SDR family oxidoreductase n=1 Tax=Nocardioides sp. LHD-245 TaxID=3051387 RepID=UPI0027E06341|nr:SDR family oxidoreductase [Nocardioides sp. LHD-245]
MELVGVGTVADQVAEGLRERGWDVRASADTGAGDLCGVLVDPGLLIPAGGGDEAADVVELLRGAVDRARARFPATGGRVVVLVSRDLLGAPARTAVAAASGALVSAVRSLALELGRSGITVNVVVGLTDAGGDDQEDTVGAHVESLLPWDIECDDLAAAISFLLDERSAYITGQVLQCTGGASLLSSLSA